MTNPPAGQLLHGRLVARNAVWNLVGQAAPLAVALFTIPPVLHGLGTQRFGALNLAWMLIGYFSLFDLGLGRALTKLVAERLGTRSEREIPVLVWTALFLMLMLGLVATVSVTVPAGWLVRSILKVPLELQDETSRALYLLGFSIPFVITTAGLRGVLEASQRFDLVNALRIPMGIFTFASPLLVLPFSHSLAAVVAVLAVGRVLAWAVHLLLCFRVIPVLRKTIEVRRSLVRPLVKLGGWMTVTNVVGPLMVYLDRFLISSLVSLAAVAYYATPFELVTKLWLVPMAVGQVLFPAFAMANSSDRARTVRLFDRGVKFVFFVLFPPTLLIVGFARGFLVIWLGPDFAQHSYRVLQWLAAGVLVNGLAQIPFSLIQGAGRADLTAKLHLCEAPFYLAGVLWMIKTYGVEGAAIAWAARATVDALILFWLAERTLSAGSRRWSFLPTLAGSGLALVVVGNVENTLMRPVLLAIALVAFIFFSWFVVLSPDERTIARNWRDGLLQ